MLLIWSGKGVFTVLIFILSTLALITLFPDGANEYPIAIAAFVTAAFSWYFGYKWNSKVGRIVIDEKTGERLEVKSNHSLFWIKMQYWSIIFSLIGVLVLAKESVVLAIIISVLLCALFVYLFKQRRKRSDELRDVFSAESSFQASEEEDEKEEESDDAEVVVDKEDSSRFMPR